MTIPKGRHLRGTTRAETARQAADLYGQGATIRSISRALGRSYGGTRVLLLEAGVTLRGRGGSVRKAGA